MTDEDTGALAIRAGDLNTEAACADAMEEIDEEGWKYRKRALDASGQAEILKAARMEAGGTPATVAEEKLRQKSKRCNVIVARLEKLHQSVSRRRKFLRRQNSGPTDAASSPMDRLFVEAARDLRRDWFDEVMVEAKRRAVLAAEREERNGPAEEPGSSTAVYRVYWVQMYLSSFLLRVSPGERMSRHKAECAIRDACGRNVGGGIGEFQEKVSEDLARRGWDVDVPAGTFCEREMTASLDDDRDFSYKISFEKPLMSTVVGHVFPPAPMTHHQVARHVRQIAREAPAASCRSVAERVAALRRRLAEEGWREDPSAGAIRLVPIDIPE